MDVNVIMQYVSYLLIAIGILAFMVSSVTQVIKSWPGLDKLPTATVVIVLSLILCPATLYAGLSLLRKPIEGYMIFACLIISMLVALVAMDGWERLKEIWDRTRYKQGKK